MSVLLQLPAGKELSLPRVAFFKMKSFLVIKVILTKRTPKPPVVKSQLGAAGMVQWLKVHSALAVPEVSSQHPYEAASVTRNSSFRESETLFWSVDTSTHIHT